MHDKMAAALKKIASTVIDQYTAICFNQNAYLVRDEYASLFAEISNEPVSLWMDAWYHESDMFRNRLINGDSATRRFDPPI